MIDCLSNPTWITPQIDFLLFLQNVRLNCSQMIDKFFLSVTILGELWLPTLICAITYWCVDFKAGLYLFSLEGVNCMLTHFFKMLACVYRPWVIDNRIRPSELAIPFARGYSFPSGHSSMSSSVLGGAAYLMHKDKIRCVMLIGLIILVGFSRLWLGVHTPQDVVCGLLTGLILVFVINRIINFLEKDKKRYIYAGLFINVLAICAIIYAFYFNTYRTDCISGQLLVDPLRFKYLMATTFGYSLGIINGCILCRILIPFNPQEASLKNKIVRGVIGGVIILLLLKYMITYIAVNISDFKIAFLLEFIMGIFITLIYPFIFTKLKF